MIEPREEQIVAIGSAVPCQAAEPIHAQGNVDVKIGSESPAPSVVIVDPNKTAWIGIELANRKKKPVPGAAWELELPDGRIVKGSLDKNGKTRVEGIDPGTCKITFPSLDRREFL